jgi:hypothetical protein
MAHISATTATRPDRKRSDLVAEVINKEQVGGCIETFANRLVEKPGLA